MSKLAAVLIAAVALAGICQTSSDTTQSNDKFNIESGGRDVRDAIHSLFTQAKRNYILDPKVHFTLYLSLHDVDFERGLTILMEQAKLQYEVRDGIYYVGPSSVTVTGSSGAAPAKPEIDWKVLLAKRVTLTKKQTALRSIAESLSRLSNVAIHVDPQLPQYILNINFDNVTLKYALDNITKAASLQYETASDGSVRIGPIDGGTAIEESHKANVKPAPALKCPSCSGALSAGWKYCPYCGYWVRPITTKK